MANPYYGTGPLRSREGLTARSSAGTDGIQLRIDPMHEDLDEQITGLHSKIRQLKGSSVLLLAQAPQESIPANYMLMPTISNSVSLPHLATAVAKASAVRPSVVSLLVSSSLFSKRRIIVATATVEATGSMASAGSLVVKLPSHPTYDLKEVIDLALVEDAGDRD